MKRCTVEHLTFRR